MTHPDENLQPPADSDADAIDADALIYFAHTTIFPLFERSARTVTWCPRWWEHPEALYRLEIVRRAWEAAVTADEPQAMSDWQLHVCDPHLAVLTSSAGPFADCTWSERKGYAQEHQPGGLPLEWPADFERDRFPALRDITQ